MSLPALSSDVPPRREPYVGLRPFERDERDLLVGRDRDCSFLCNKIFSSPLTLLYARSGVGKSSLLRALVIPALEDQSCLVVYFDGWAGGEEALHTLKGSIVELAGRLGVPHPDAGSPTLRELVGITVAAARKTLVLVFDQFEDLLVAGGSAMALLRTELAGLIRAEDLDVHVLISLREEYLAALEPLRSEILELFRSTYRLEGLADEVVRRAILEPARVFGVSWEPSLVARLIADLRARPNRVPSTDARRNPEPIQLPFLQLVCSRIWADRDAEEGTVGLELYRLRGGVEGILEDYVEEVMPASIAGQVVTATMLQSLAPPSGLKIALTAADLVSIHRQLRPRAVEVELERLTRCRILVGRKYGGEQRFELQHDALIDVLAPWRENVLRASRRRRRWRTAGAVMLLIAIYGGMKLKQLEELKVAYGTVSQLEATRAELRGENRRLRTQREDYQREIYLEIDEANRQNERLRSRTEQQVRTAQLELKRVQRANAAVARSARSMLEDLFAKKLQLENQNAALREKNDALDEVLPYPGP